MLQSSAWSGLANLASHWRPKSHEISTKLLQNIFLLFLDSLVCVLASQKKFTKHFAGERTDKANLQNVRHERI